MNDERQFRLFPLALISATVLAYLPGLGTPFTQYDDNLYITQNLSIRVPGWAGLLHQWNGERAWGGDFVEFFPLRDTVYWALFQVFRLNSLPYHLVNLAFHVAATLLFLGLLRRLKLSARAAAFGSMLFALHPVHIESVVWIAGLKDPMYTTFMLLGLWAYAGYRQHPAPGRYALMLVSLVLALLVKSMAIAMPLLMLLMEWLLAPRAKWWLVILRLAGPGLVTGLFFATFMAIGRANKVLVPPHGGTWFTHTTLALFAQAKYLKQTLLPSEFRFIYCMSPPTGWSDWRLWVGAACVLGLLGTFVLAARRWPLYAFFIGWYVAALLPVSNLVPFPALMADRYLYAASAGACGLLGLLAARLRPRAWVLVAAATATLLGGTTAARSALWWDEEILWQEADEDPACMTDTSFPAAQAHILRFRSTKDRRVGLEALTRAVSSPGFQSIDLAVGCSTLVSAAGEELSAGNTESATRLARTANRMCPLDAAGWTIAAIINMKDRPDIAAMAALKSYRLRKNASTETLMWLTQLRIDKGSSGPAALATLARTSPPETCPRVLLWSTQYPDEAARIIEAVSACGGPPSQASPSGGAVDAGTP